MGNRAGVRCWCEPGLHRGGQALVQEAPFTAQRATHGEQFHMSSTSRRLVLSSDNLPSQDHRGIQHTCCSWQTSCIASAIASNVLKGELRQKGKRKVCKPSNRLSCKGRCYKSLESSLVIISFKSYVSSPCFLHFNKTLATSNQTCGLIYALLLLWCLIPIPKCIMK